MPRTKTKQARHGARDGERAGRRFFATAIPVLAATALIGGYSVLNARQQSEVLRPKFVMLNFRDRSMSFSEGQFKKMLSVHDQIYSACFAGAPVKYSAFVFGNGLEETGAVVSTSPKDTWNILDLPGDVSSTATKMSLAIDHACKVASQEPKSIVAFVFESDGEATDGPALDQAVKRLAIHDNVAYVAVIGVIPSTRIPLAKTMAPLGERFLQFNLDRNNATMIRLSGLVAKAGGTK